MIDVVPDSQLFSEMCSVVRRRIPNFQVEYKNESVYHKFINVILFFNPRYMTRFTSTRRRKVAFPNREFVTSNPVKAAKVLAHEYVHLLDWENHPILMPLLYVFPQFLTLLALTSLLSFWYSNWFLLGLGAALFILPWPAIFRAQLEMRGYAMSIAFNIWRHGSLRESTRDWIVEAFTNWSYYKMWWRKKDVRQWLAIAERRIHNIDAVKVTEEDLIFNDSEAYTDVYQLLTGVELDEPVDEEEY